MRAHSRQGGFTFIELVMFIVIVGVAVTAITLLFVQNVRYSADPLIRQKSLAVAKAYMDEIVRKKWDELTPEGGGCTHTSASSTCDPGWQPNTVFSVGQRAQPVAYNTHLYEVITTGGNNRSGGTEPVWPTGGGTVIDNNVTWQDLGTPAIGADGAELRTQFDDVDDYHNPTAQAPQYPDPGDLVDGESPMPGYDNFTVTVTVSQPASAWETVPANDVKRIDLSVAAPNGETLNFTLYRLNY
jgi:type II secretory pathway pseudopilin PulG